MLIHQYQWHAQTNWLPNLPKDPQDNIQLVMFFGSTTVLENKVLCMDIHRLFPKAKFIGCSTAGEIMDTTLKDSSLVINAIEFKHTELKQTQVILSETGSSFEAGKKITESLSAPELKHIFVLSDGLQVNGSELVKGLQENLPANITVTGGLAGDGDQFKKTMVCHNKEPQSGVIAAIGFYGDKLQVGHGSVGGWDPFGPERVITKSKGNLLFELDNESALDLYKNYLGNYAKDLPASALLFPLSLRTKDGETEIVRTILGIDETNKCMTFAGDLPEGSYTRFMKANFDRLIDGSTQAANLSNINTGKNPELAILISCIGRKLVLKQRTEEELEAVAEVFGPQTKLTGFYSYGEIAPAPNRTHAELHNQTMTITTFWEND